MTPGFTIRRRTTTRTESTYSVTTGADRPVASSRSYIMSNPLPSMALAWRQASDLPAVAVTPSMVIKESYVHLQACNIMRVLMSEAARRAGRERRTISFHHARQPWSAFPAPGAMLTAAMLSTLLARLVQHKVGNRPGCCEPAYSGGLRPKRSAIGP